MTQSNNRFLDELAKLMTDAAGAAQGMRREVETLMKAQGERLLRDLDLVQREEFEAVKDMRQRPARRTNGSPRASPPSKARSRPCASRRKRAAAQSPFTGDRQAVPNFRGARPQPAVAFLPVDNRAAVLQRTPACDYAGAGSRQTPRLDLSKDSKRSHRVRVKK